jgi:CheY-like chemotaxis protein
MFVLSGAAITYCCKTQSITTTSSNAGKKNRSKTPKIDVNLMDLAFKDIKTDEMVREINEHENGVCEDRIHIIVVSSRGLIKCAILSTTQQNPKSSGLPSPEYVSCESVDLTMQSLHHKVCSRQLWQNSM